MGWGGGEGSGNGEGVLRIWGKEMGHRERGKISRREKERFGRGSGKGKIGTGRICKRLRGEGRDKVVTRSKTQIPFFWPPEYCCDKVDFIFGSSRLKESGTTWLYVSWFRGKESDFKRECSACC